MSAEKPAETKPSTTSQAGPSTSADSGKKKLPQLGALEDDDEFEEFPASAQGGNVADALAKMGHPGDRLWEENWDDDDIEDDFTKQLRTAISNRNGGADEPMKE